MLKVNFTMCFFENPAALHDIKMWEELKFDKIVSKLVQPDGTRVYLVTLDPEECGYYYEIVYCTDIKMIYDSSQLHNFRLKMHSFVSNYAGSEISLDYNKSIIFGKVKSGVIEVISEMIQYLENTGG